MKCHSTQIKYSEMKQNTGLFGATQTHGMQDMQRDGLLHSLALYKFTEYLLTDTAGLLDLHTLM